jgi:cysteine desulfurase
MALDLEGVMVSSGAACSSGKVKSSHVLKAMNIADDVAACALRASFGWNSSEGDVDVAVAAFSKLLQRVRPRVAA